VTDRLRMAVWLVAFLFFCSPLFAQEEETAESEEGMEVEESTGAQKEEKASAPAQEEEKASEESATTAEPAETPKAEELSAEVKEEGEKEEKKEEEEEKKYSVGLTNVFSQNTNANRPNFGYALTLSAGYTMPWELNLSASIGFAYNLSYARTREAAFDTSGYAEEKMLNHYSFDGTPLQMGLSRKFMIPIAEIGVTPSIGWSLPFTSRMLWEVYTQRSTLGPSVTIDRAFKLMEGMTLSIAYTCAYAYNFAEYDWAWDKYSNQPIDVNVQMAFTNMLSIAWSFKSFSLRIGAGYESSIKYGEFNQVETVAKHQLWDHSVIFQGAANYTMKGFTDNDNFTFGLGFTTAGPEFEDGNFVDASLPGGESYPNYKKSAGYLTPFAGKYTKIAATIGYNYSF